MSDYVMPNLQKERIKEYLKSGKRLDGRKVDEYRNLEVELNVSHNAESSVRVKLGKTEVYAGVKMAVVEPYPDSPDEGTFMTTTELHPLASNDYEVGKPGIESVEIARIIDRGIRESGFIDFEKLCIEKGKKVWQVFLDIFAVNDDGNMLDVAGIASLIALGNAKLPKYDAEKNKIEHELSSTPLPLNKDALSFNMTIHKVGTELLADVSREEEMISDYRMSIAVGDNDGALRITAMQKGKAGSVSSSDMEKILNLVEAKFKDMFPKIRKLALGK